MRSLFLASAAVALLAGAVKADPVYGVWRTQLTDSGGYGHVTMSACGALVCGDVTGGFDREGRPTDSPHIGKRIIWDMTPNGDGAYGGGRILDPERGQIYRSKMTVAGNRLTVSGCVGPICRRQVWQRVR